jgi:hypothetical protein
VQRLFLDQMLPARASQMVSQTLSHEQVDAARAAWNARESA